MWKFPLEPVLIFTSHVMQVIVVTCIWNSPIMCVQYYKHYGVCVCLCLYAATHYALWYVQLIQMPPVYLSLRWSRWCEVEETLGPSGMLLYCRQNSGILYHHQYYYSRCGPTQARCVPSGTWYIQRVPFEYCPKYWWWTMHGLHICSELSSCSTEIFSKWKRGNFTFPFLFVFITTKNEC